MHVIGMLHVYISKITFDKKLFLSFHSPLFTHSFFQTTFGIDEQLLPMKVKDLNFLLKKSFILVYLIVMVIYPMISHHRPFLTLL